MDHLAARLFEHETYVSKSPRFAQPGPMLPGCDLSHYNVPPNWGNAVFSWLKATQGIHFHDPEFLSLAAQAQQRGIFRGAYHFFTSDDPIAQAKFFVQTVGKNTDLGYALDWEEHPTLVSQALAFCNEVEQLTGRVCVIYSYLGFLEGIGSHALAPFARHPLWIADLSHGGPHIPAPWKSATFWQYKFGQGSQPDLDVFYGQLPDLKAMIK